MITVKTRRKGSLGDGPPKFGLAVAGGGPVGGIYELGALTALDDALDGVQMDAMDVYVGVSSGALIAASLANHISTHQMCRVFIQGDNAEHALKPRMFLRPAYREIAKRLLRLPSLVTRAVTEFVRNPFDRSLREALAPLGGAIPAGIFDNEVLARHLKKIFNATGRTNDFRQLESQLFVLAVDLDTGLSVRFGEAGYDHIPISTAVQASSALPGLFPPVNIEGNWYVDGALRRTLHASAALREGVDLLFGINPIVPFDASLAAKRSDRRPRELVREGLPTVLSQTFRALIQSRMQIGMEKYQDQYEHTDLVLLEPDRGDSTLFFTNIFSYSSRRWLCEHAYQATRMELLAQADELEPVLNAHGIGLNRSVLEDQDRTLASAMDSSPRSMNPVTDLLSRTLGELDQLLNLSPNRTRH